MLLPIIVGLAPVTTFLVALVLLDSYKLVKLRFVVLAVACGVLAAFIAYGANGVVLECSQVGFLNHTRYIAPFLEEFLKGVIIVAFIRTHRIGFLVDAAIMGFAVGAGFAMVENLVYLMEYPDATMGTWNVRGFGTAIMLAAGATAIFAVAGLAMMDRSGEGIGCAPSCRRIRDRGRAALGVQPIFFLSPRLSTLGVAIVVSRRCSMSYSCARKRRWANGSGRASMRIRRCCTSSTRDRSRILL